MCSARKNCEFLGYQSPKQLPALFNKSRSSVFPSKFEGLPLVMLEQMASGVVPISTKVGDIEDVIDDEKNGFRILYTKPFFWKSALIIAKKLYIKAFKEQMVTINMNIMFQVGSWHYQKGGTDLFVRTLSYWLAKHGHKVVVLVHRLEEEKCSDEDIRLGDGIIKVRYTPPQRKGVRFNPFVYTYRLIITSKYLYKLAKKEEIDAIVVGETELLSTISLKLLKTKIICRGGALMYETMSKEVIKEGGDNIYSRFFIYLIKAYNFSTLKLPDLMVPVNQSEYEFMKLHKRKDARIKTIPHGVDLKLFKPSSQKPGRKIIVGYVGRLAPIKYPEVILNIFKGAARDVKNAELQWLGPLDPSFSKDYFENLKKETGVSNARYLGQIKNEELPKYLNKMNVFLQAEQQKNVSRSTTEAAACGLPIVALNIGKEPYGFFTMKRDEAIKELRKLITDGSYRKMKGKEARKVMEKDYSEDKIYKKYLKTFEEIKWRK